MHLGQAKAWRSEKRFVVVLAGSQGGKTSWGPIWLKRECDRSGAGDHLAVTANYDLFKLKMLPALRELFEHIYQCGRFWSGDRIIELKNPETGKFEANRADDPMWGRIILRSADTEGGLESSTAKSAWLDEAGLFRDGNAWEAVLRRLSLSQGRILVTTTVYDLGWMKRRLYDPWIAASKNHAEIDIINFDSTANPSFPPAEYERAKRELPLWKFNMFYRGLFERPAGAIYDCFDAVRHIMPRFAIPDYWPRHVGLDFGGVNTAAVYLAEELTAEPERAKTGRYIIYREYHAGGKTAKEHAAELLRGEPRVPTCVGGSQSEGQWRQEFAQGGLPIAGPTIKDVEVGIDRVYGLIKADKLIVFGDCTRTLDDIQGYSRELDAAGDPTEKIANKDTYHQADALRYIATRLVGGRAFRIWV